MAKINNCNQKIEVKGKKRKGKKLPSVGFEPGSLDPKSDVLPTELLRREILGPKITIFELLHENNC